MKKYDWPKKLPRSSYEASSNPLYSLRVRLSAKIPNFSLRSPTTQGFLNAAQRYEHTFRVSHHIIHILGLSYALVLGTTLGAVMAAPIAFTLNTFLTLNFGSIALGLAFWRLYKATQAKQPFRYERSFGASVAFLGAFVFALCFPSTLMTSTILHPISFVLLSHFLSMVILYPFFPIKTRTTQYALTLFGLLLFCATAPISFQTLGLGIGLVIAQALLAHMQHWQPTRMVCAKIQGCLPTRLPTLSDLLSKKATPQPARPNLSCLFDPLIDILQHIHSRTPTQHPVFGDLNKVNVPFYSMLVLTFNEHTLTSILLLKQQLTDPTSCPTEEDLERLNRLSNYCSTKLTLLTSMTGPFLGNFVTQLNISPKQLFSAYPAATSIPENYSWETFLHQAIGGIDGTPRDIQYESMAKTELSFEDPNLWKTEMGNEQRCTLTLFFQLILAMHDFTGIQQALEAHQQNINPTTQTRRV